MDGTGRRILSGVSALAVVAAGIGLVVGEDACILAQPSGDLPRLPETRPTILHASLVPPTSAVLTSWPESFSVPVELTDPSVVITYVGFVDYNPLTGDGLVFPPQHDPPPADAVRIRMLEVPITPPPNPDRCHRIEIIVALSLASENDPKNAHTPAAPGGDIATWFYNPGGGLGGCPQLDAGIDASGGAADASEGGTQ